MGITAAWIWTTTLATAPSKRETIVSMDVYLSLSRRPEFIAGRSARHQRPSVNTSDSFIRLLRHKKPDFAPVCAVGPKRHPILPSGVGAPTPYPEH
jgi:hypothetical protein